MSDPSSTPAQRTVLYVTSIIVLVSSSRLCFIRHVSSKDDDDCFKRMQAINIAFAGDFLPEMTRQVVTWGFTAGSEGAPPLF